jgi:CubicO group peptidase (beta-lactamase class C family)
MSPDIAGVWESPWGTFTLRTAPTDDNKRAVTGFYVHTRDQTGLIKSASFDPSTGVLEFAYEAPWWGNDTKGTAKLKLAAAGKKLAGPYLTTNKDGGRDEGVLTLTFGRNLAWRAADVAGIWDSPWGLFTLRAAPADGNKRAVTGTYASDTGKNRTGLVKSGVFDPATGILELAYEAPWWGNQTKGTAFLTLDAAGNRFQGLYATTNQDGDMDEGVISLLRLGGNNFAAAIDSIFADAGIKPDTPGAAVEVIDHGQVIFSKCAGLARLTDKKAITRQTTFDLCSMGKQFTGAAILRLYEQGKLNLDDDIRRFIPEMPVYDAKNPIRILHVARMTSGLPDVIYAENVKGKNPDYLTNEDFAGEFARQWDTFPLKYPTGQRYQYSNTGYMVLALIVERASQRTYSDFITKEFFEPLGMKTAWVNDTPSSSLSNPAYGYYRDKDVFQFGTGPASTTHAKLLPVGHGGVWASLDDLERWDAGWREGKIIKPATQKLALVASKTGDGNVNGYAFGWYGLPLANGKLEMMAHNGNFAGFLTLIERNVAEQRTLVVLCNSGTLDVAVVNRVFDAMPPKRQQK